MHAQKHGPVLRVELQMGPPNGLLPTRYECIDRLFAQVNGRRRVLLIPPSQAGHSLDHAGGAGVSAHVYCM